MMTPVLPKDHIMNQIDVISAKNGLCDVSTECPFCSSRFLVKKGKNRRTCKNCGKNFVLPSHRQRQTFPKYCGKDIKSWSDDDRKNPVTWSRGHMPEDHAVVRRGAD